MSETLIGDSPRASKEKANAGMPRRILFVHNSADIYGASRSLLRLSAALDRTRFQPIVLLPEEGPLVPLLKQAGVEVMIMGGMSIITRDVFKSWRMIPFLCNVPIAAARLRSIIRRHRIDLVHTNVGTILFSGLGARFAGVPHVWHIRDWYGEFRGLWHWYRKYILAFSDVVICVSRAIAAQFQGDPKVVVIHNGFRLRDFEQQGRAELRKQCGIEESRVVIGCVGRIKFVRKGQEFLVRAAAASARERLRLRAPHRRLAFARQRRSFAQAASTRGGIGSDRSSNFHR